MSDRFIVVVDESKLVDHLGPVRHPARGARLRAGRRGRPGARRWARPTVTTRDVRSDNGNLLMDAHFGPIEDPIQPLARLAVIPGLVEHGLFAGSLVERVVVAGPDGVRELTR